MRGLLYMVALDCLVAGKSLAFSANHEAINSSKHGSSIGTLPIEQIRIVVVVSFGTAEAHQGGSLELQNGQNHFPKQTRVNVRCLIYNNDISSSTTGGLQ